MWVANSSAPPRRSHAAARTAARVSAQSSTRLATIVPGPITHERRRHPHPRGAAEQSPRPRPRSAARRADRRHGRQRLGQVVARVRYGVLRRPAALRRDVLAVRAAVPRPHGQAAGRPHRGHPARDRDRSDEPRAHVALDGRHDDGAQRPPEAPVRARRACSTAATAAARCGATTRSRSTRSSRASPRVGGARAVLVTFTVDDAGELQPRRDREISDGAGLHAHSRAHEDFDRGHPGSRRVRRRATARGSSRRSRPRSRSATATSPCGLRRRRRPGRTRCAAFKFSAHRHCAHCDIAYDDVIPNSFSFNSPVGACEQCRGFGRTIGIDYRLVIPDEEQDARRAARSSRGRRRAMRSAKTTCCATRSSAAFPSTCRGASSTTSSAHGSSTAKARGGRSKWYGVARFFAWLESKAYKMHVRVLLSKYRSYDACRACGGARLKPVVARCGGSGRWPTRRAVIEPRRSASAHICRRSTTRHSRRCRASRFTTS